MTTQTAAVPLKPRSILLDTNVWINSQLGMHDGYEEARKLLVFARENGVRIGVAFHSLTDIFYVVRQELERVSDAAAEHVTNDDPVPDSEGGAMTPERVSAIAKEVAWGVVNSIMDYAEVIGGDGSDARIAVLHRNLHDDFEDDLILAAAHRMGADLIISDDVAFLKHSPLPALSVKDALVWLTA